MSSDASHPRRATPRRRREAALRTTAIALPMAMVAAGGLLVPGQAWAQEERQDVLYGKHAFAESPQHFAIEVRFSPFVPDIDSDPALHGARPYQSVFGTSPIVLVEGEFDWQAARIPHLGTVGPGLGFGYTTTTANAQFVTPQNGQTTSGETTTLQIFPVYVVGVLRADALWREVGVPLVPYAKLGLGMAFWRASNTLGTSHSQGVAGVGQSWGTNLALGLGFNLNVFDQYTARNFDDTLGVNNTYVFGEWTRSDLTGLFSQQDPLRVGGTFWTFGLAFEF